GGGQAGHLQHGVDLALRRAVEHRRRERHALAQVLRELHQLLVGELGELVVAAAGGVDALDQLLHFAGLVLLLLDELADPQPEAFCRPAEVRFQNLPNVHPRRYAERIQHEIHRRAVGHVRHVFHRHDLRDDALVAVAAGHLVARLQAALHRDVHLYHLQHARRQLVALGELLLLRLEHGVELAALLAERVLETLDLRRRFLLGELLRAAVGDLAVEQALQALERVVLDDAHLVVQVRAIALELVLDDALASLVPLDTFAGEDLHIDHRAADAGGHAQRGVLNVGRLLAENRAQQLLFRRELGLALRRHLADQHIARFDFGADVDDARLVQPDELRLGEVRDVAGNLFGPELRVPRDDGELLDVDRGEAVVGHHPLADQDRVLEVEAVPRHERDQHVLAERELAEIGRGAIGHHVALGDALALLHDRALVDVGVLVGARVLGELVDVHTDVAGDRFVVVHAHDDAVRIHVVDHAAAQRDDAGSRVDRRGALDARADQRLLR